MKKIGVLLFLSVFVLFSSFNSSVSAASVKEQLTSVAEQTKGMEVVDDLPKGTPVVKFDSVADFEEAVKAVQENRKEAVKNEDNVVEESVVSKSEPGIFVMAAAKKAVATKNGSSQIKWHEMTWNPLNFKYDTDLWIQFTYSYTGSGSKKKFAKIKSVHSGNGGFPMNWNQTTSVTNIYDSNRSVSIKIQGYFLVGVNIGGQTVGTKFTDSFTKKYHLQKANKYPYDK
ncbi:hypothetical protein KY305_19645 [Bacillus sp. YC2]|uniref:hypothetical protein n=1 Tax=Bacillus sp. YC2 TaxID=2861287 RepID=UPI001CA70AB9|nr:hypothetical protein [Bacillus sp. YC2]MBY8914932.1 hypothetical protein [Bacillus sp. YC2]